MSLVPGAPPVVPTASEATARLAQWATSHGAELSRVVLTPEGVFAAERLEAGAEILCVPLKLRVSAELVNATGLAAIVLESERSIGVLQAQGLLAAKMLFDTDHRDARAQSLLGDYFAAWSTETDHLPATWSKEEVKDVGIGAEYLYPDYKSVRKALLAHPALFGSPPRDAYSEANYTRAFALSLAKAIPGSLDATEVRSKWDSHPLFPVIDSLGHDPKASVHERRGEHHVWKYRRPAQVPGVGKQGARLCLVAGRPVRRHGEVTVTRGSDDLGKFWARTGQLHDYVEDDSIVFRFAGVNLMFNPELAKGFYEDGAPTVTDDRAKSVYPVRINRYNLRSTLLPWCRVTSTDETNNWHIADTQAMDAFCTRPFNASTYDFSVRCGISDANEAEAVATLRKTIDDLLKAGPTTIAEDEALIAAAADVPASQRPKGQELRRLVAAQYRLRMKRMLADAIKVYDAGK
jgi:hypothetical protein